HDHRRRRSGEANAALVATHAPSSRERRWLMTNVRSALYCRASTTDQKVEMQLVALREYAERRGWQVAAEYVDQGVSGSKKRRPALDKLMADARRRAMDAVVVFRFDRFARSVSQLARALDEFRALGIEFVSLHEAIDTSTPMGRAMFHIAGAFAELEREIIRERVRAGLANARRRGKKLGRRRLLLNHEKIAKLASRGLSGHAIARELGVSEFTVRRILNAGRVKNSLRPPLRRLTISRVSGRRVTAIYREGSHAAATSICLLRSSAPTWRIEMTTH